MLTIILGIVLAVLIFKRAINVYNNDLSTFLAVIAAIVGVLGIGAGLCAPLSGYTEWELIQETELVSLTNNPASGGVGKLTYVSLSADNAYTYRYEIDSEFGTETSREYDTNTLVNKDVEEIEDYNCKKPVIREYQKKGKRTIWTFAFDTTITKYIFYVPEGTISKEVKLN